MGLRSLAELLWPKHTRGFFGVVALMVGAAFLETLQVALLFPVFVSLTHGVGEGTLGRLAALLALGPWDPLVNGLCALLAVTILKGGAVLWRDRQVAGLSGTIQHELKMRLIKLYADSAYAFFLDRKPGPLMYAVVTAATKVGTLIQKGAQFMAEWAKVAAIGLLALLIAPVPMLIVMALGLVYLALTRWISGQVSYHTGKGRAEAGAEQVSVMNEFLGGVRQIMAFGTQPLWQQRLERQSRIFRDLFVKDSVWLSVPKVALDLFLVGLLCGGLLLAHLFEPAWTSRQLPILAVFAVSCLRLVPSLTLLGHIRMEVAGLRAEAEQVHDLLANPVPRPQGGGRAFPGLRERIVLEGVGFAYQGRPEALREISLEFEKGTMTALVGPSGGGKTTLAHLLLGFLSPTRGRVLVDGVPLSEYSLESWRRRIGFVPQDSFLYHASVEENITFGRSGFSAEQVHRAADIAHAHEFISRLPQGYATTVGERGMKLSGGQQQRLAIARAVLHNPGILILDEATSFLDAESERLVQEAIERISVDRTVILIAHRLSTVRGCGQVVVLEDGRVVEQGPPERLLQEKGRYYQLFSSGLPARGDAVPEGVG